MLNNAPTETVCRFEKSAKKVLGQCPNKPHRGDFVPTDALLAGTGDYLDEGNFEMVCFPESSLPYGAEFAIRVDGNGFIKAYEEQEPEADELEDYTDSNEIVPNKPVLISCNDAYEPRFVKPTSRLEIIGRVLN